MHLGVAALDRGAWLAREGILVFPDAVAHVGAQVAARAAGLAQGEVVAVHHTYVIEFWSIARRAERFVRGSGGLRGAGVTFLFIRFLRLVERRLEHREGGKNKMIRGGLSFLLVPPVSTAGTGWVTKGLDLIRL